MSGYRAPCWASWLALVALMLAIAQVRGSPIDCVKQKDAALCDDLDNCVWCVGSKVATAGYCYPMTAAKLLPSRFFACDKDPSEKVADVQDSGCDKRSEDQCVSPDCVWCTSAAVGGGCYTPTEAKMLPSAIFHCKTSPSSMFTAVA